MSITIERNKVRRVATGTFSACCHRIEFYYEIDRLRLTDDELEQLENEAEERARHDIALDYVSGELCAVIRNEHELHGWWAFEDESEAAS